MKSADFEVKQVSDCPALKDTALNKFEALQNCFNFTDENGVDVYLPQFELARALYFNDAYLARSALQPGILGVEFDIQLFEDKNRVRINVLPTAGYPLSSFDNPAARRVLSWILVDPSARNSYESINKNQYLSGYEDNNFRIWNFQFEPPHLDEVEFTVYGKFDKKSNSIFVYEIKEINNLSHNVPRNVSFFHPKFTEKVHASGNRAESGSNDYPDEYSIDDGEEPNSDNKPIILETEPVVFNFLEPHETTKHSLNKSSGSSGRKDENEGDIISLDVSTEEGSVMGNLPSAEYSGVVDESDDTHLYASRFERFQQMIDCLKEKHDCTIYSYPLKKLPKMKDLRCEKHLLKNGNPRCIKVVKVSYEGSQFMILEVDMGDFDKPSLSTKILRLNDAIKWEIELKQINYLFVKKYLSWPRVNFDRICGKKGHGGIPHPETIKDSNVLPKGCVEPWAGRVFCWLKKV